MTMTMTHPAPQATGAPALRLRNISKSFAGNPAVKGVSLELKRGEVVGLIGENGAGKSTLLKILSGLYRPDSGTIEANGKVVEFRRPQDAAAAGVGVVHQEQSLLTNLSVAENLTMNALSVKDSATRYGLYRWRRLNREAREILDRIGVEIDPRTIVSDLSFVDRQMVEIARALKVDEATHAAPIVILDEPTSLLERNETAILEREIRTLREIGSVIFVSHRLDEVLRICDRIVVMRNGEVVADRPTATVSEDELFRLMIGHESRARRRTDRRAAGEASPVLEVHGLSHAGIFRNVSFSLAPGSCLAIVGAMGSGREAVCRALFGAEGYDAGSITFDGAPLRRWSPQRAVRRGIGYVPSERKVEGMVGGLSAAENLTLAHAGGTCVGPVVRPRRRTGLAREWFERIDVRPRNPKLHLGRFSGGNQQKVVMAKWLHEEGLKVLVLDHPLRGLDPGAAETVNAQIRAACDAGVAVVLLPDTLEEALEMGDHIVVMRDGDVVAHFNAAEDGPTSLELLEAMV